MIATVAAGSDANPNKIPRLNFFDAVLIFSFSDIILYDRCIFRLCLVKAFLHFRYLRFHFRLRSLSKISILSLSRNSSITARWTAKTPPFRVNYKHFT
jgi:hypothetical protein